MSETPTVTVSMSEFLTGRLDRPLGKEDLDVFRTHFAASTSYDEVNPMVRDAVKAWRAGRAMALARERRLIDAILGGTS